MDSLVLLFSLVDECDQYRLIATSVDWRDLNPIDIDEPKYD